ncbi:uncharacterized protein LOC124941809 [Impatiens glandulifera]|uniref:uncharacterized protein LOC124941809 n=1 Tax=Impatiens glandulifera TaxID=253017 RepID=UPI001FB189A9|nr:uncharacterized protein LOC124941809 [Impatiens glandulifera]
MEEAHFSIGNKNKVVVICLLLFLFIMEIPFSHGIRIGISQNNLQVNKHLQLLNKPAIKSIKSPDGDIIDCIHITQQPSFDHPLFQNHTIQMRPSYHPDGLLFGENKMSIGKKSRGLNQLWHRKGKSCPEGTIPVRRTTEDDVFRASSIKSYGKKMKMKMKNKYTRTTTVSEPAKSAEPDIITQSGHQHAIAYVEGGEKYYGAKATMNVWEPQIQETNEFSLSQIWILAGSFSSDLNSIEAGWQVSPDLYGDNNTRLFSYWTNDAYQATGCYNLLCSGFIQINSDIAMGASISPLSTYNGNQYDITILIWKDPKEGNWWMQFGDNHVIGYWPSFLFTYLTDSASMVEWGGEVVNMGEDDQHTTTQMGSGHFPNEGFGKASYFRNIQIVDGTNKLRQPQGIETFTEQSDCYDVKLGRNGDWGNYFYYGGPGRNSNCP